MNRYGNHETSNPRAALGAAAIAMAAITMTLSLVLPAKMTSGGREERVAALSKAVAPAAAGAVSGPLRIEVIGVREPSFASAQGRNVQAKRKQQG